MKRVTQQMVNKYIQQGRLPADGNKLIMPDAELAYHSIRAGVSEISFDNEHYSQADAKHELNELTVPHGKWGEYNFNNQIINLTNDIDSSAIEVRNDCFISRISDIGNISMAGITFKESDDYFATRPWGSQIGAWASHQSSHLSSREELEQRFEGAAKKWPEGSVVPRPPHWGGYRVTPLNIEFWQGRYSRLHDRLRYERDDTDSKWSLNRYYP